MSSDRIIVDEVSDFAQTHGLPKDSTPADFPWGKTGAEILADILAFKQRFEENYRRGLLDSEARWPWLGQPEKILSTPVDEAVCRRAHQRALVVVRLRGMGVSPS